MSEGNKGTLSASRESGRAMMLWGEDGGSFIYNLVRYQGVWRSTCCGGRSVDVSYIGWGGGVMKCFCFFCYFVYLVFSIFVSMSFTILHHLLLLSETGQ